MVLFVGIEMMINSAEQFAALRTSADPALYGRAAHDHASIDTWLDVIARFPEMRTWVAHNKTVPLEILHVLARDPDPQVRTCVACKRKLDAQLFHDLSLDPDEVVRSQIALNAKVPLEILERLAADTTTFVSGVAKERLMARGK